MTDKRLQSLVNEGKLGFHRHECGIDESAVDDCERGTVAGGDFVAGECQAFIEQAFGNGEIVVGFHLSER